MVKPIGIDAYMRVVVPSRVEDAIWNAVQEAIGAGWTPERFKQEAASAWHDELTREAKHAVKVLTSRAQEK